MAQEWMNDPTLAGIDPAKMALLNSLVQQGSKKNQNEMLAFLMSAAANSKRNGLQSGGNGYDREGVEKRKIAAGNRKDGPDAVDDENAPAGIKE